MIKNVLLDLESIIVKPMDTIIVVNLKNGNAAIVKMDILLTMIVLNV